MSWSVSASGPAEKVAEQLEQQFDKIKMNDPGEQQTVDNARVLILQTLRTIHVDKPVRVTASGSMAFKDWTTKTEPHQSLDVKIEPIHFTV